MSTQRNKSYKALMSGLKELDLRRHCVPCDLVLTGDHAFPLLVNSCGQVLMAASQYGGGRIVVLAHECYMFFFPALVENALIWLKGDESANISVGIQRNMKDVAKKLNNPSFKFTVVNTFTDERAVDVYMTSAYKPGADAKDLVAFLKDGGGVLIGGQAWNWLQIHPKGNSLLQFDGNKVSAVAGIYFSDHDRRGELLPVHPEMPSAWMSVIDHRFFVDDLKFLLKGVSKVDIADTIIASEVLVHGPLAFPICSTEDGRSFLAASYYGKGRVVVVGHEGLLRQEVLAPLWNNVISWLDQGRNGVVGVMPELDKPFDIFSKSMTNCKKSNISKDMSVFVRDSRREDHLADILEFVAEGGGLLMGGQAWYWTQGNNRITDYPGNKILNKMGLCLLGDTIKEGSYTAPEPRQAINDSYYFRHFLNCFTVHVNKGVEFTEHEKKYFKKLAEDCKSYLSIDAEDGASYTRVLSALTAIVKKLGIPQVSESHVVKSAKGRMRLSLATEVYKVSPDADALLPYLMKDMPASASHKIKIDVNTAEKEEWISTGLYLSPGMKTFINTPPEIVNRQWKIQIGCQTDKLGEVELKRAPSVHVDFSLDSEIMPVHNLWGGLIYLVAPPNTKMEGVEVTVHTAIRAPYYKSGVTTAAEWLSMRSAPSPWAELEFDNIIFTVPSDVVRSLDRPDELAARWNEIMRAIADLAVIPHTFPRKERFVTDVQISHGWMHSGYPNMAYRAAATNLVSAHLPNYEGTWGAIHELGHNQQRQCWEFPPNTTECTCNLWSVYVHEEVLGINRAKAHVALSPTAREARTKKFVTEGRKFSSWAVFLALETYLQLQEKFGWDAFKKVFAAYHKMSNCPTDKKEKMNLYAVTFSQTVGMNLSAFFKAWSWPIETATEEKLSQLPLWSDHPMAKYD